MPPYVADGLLEASTNDEILGHGLGGAAGLRDDDEERATELEPTEKRRDGARIDVVENVEPRPSATLVARERVPLWFEQRRPECDRSESGAADPEHDHVVELSARSCREVGRLLVQRTVRRQVEKPKLVRLTTALKSSVGAREVS